MSKQISLLDFVSKVSSINNNERKSKFKHNKPDERKPLGPSSFQNTNMSNSTNFIEISDDERVPSPVDDVVTSSPTKDNDSFSNLKEEDLTFMRTTKSTTKRELTVDDIYAKYGSPVKNNTFDIDKSLKSNPSYMEATEKLNENLHRLDTIKPAAKPPGKSKFKFNVPTIRPTNTNETNSSSPSNDTNISTPSLLSSRSRTETSATNNQSSSKNASTRNAISMNKTVAASFTTPSISKNYEPSQQSIVSCSSKTIKNKPASISPPSSPKTNYLTDVST